MRDTLRRLWWVGVFVPNVSPFNPGLDVQIYYKLFSICVINDYYLTQSLRTYTCISAYTYTDIYYVMYISTSAADWLLSKSNTYESAGQAVSQAENWKI